MPAENRDGLSSLRLTVLLVSWGNAIRLSSPKRIYGLQVDVEAR